MQLTLTVSLYKSVPLLLSSYCIEKDLLQMALACCGKARAAAALIANLMIAFLPAAFLGLLLDKHIEFYLGNNLNAICGALILGALVMLWVERKRKLVATISKRKQLNDRIPHLKKAFYIGCLQCLAMWPSTSRSMATITGGLLSWPATCGSRQIQFFIGIHNLISCIWLQDTDRWSVLLSGLKLGPLISGIFGAFVTSLIAVKWFVAYIQSLRNGSICLVSNHLSVCDSPLL